MLMLFLHVFCMLHKIGRFTGVLVRQPSHISSPRLDMQSVDEDKALLETWPSILQPVTVLV